MRIVFLCIVAFLGLPKATMGQTAASDTQTLQALLSEVRALRQELRLSLNRTQSMQILLVRFQMQEGVIAHASDRLNEARQRLSDTRIHQKEMAIEVKRLEDSLNAAENQQQQTDLQDRIKHAKSDLEVVGSVIQQQQAAETQAEQQMRDEQDKLNVLESQLDELVRDMDNANEKSNTSRP
jgi:hypothetical protein